MNKEFDEFLRLFKQYLVMQDKIDNIDSKKESKKLQKEADEFLASLDCNQPTLDLNLKINISYYLDQYQLEHILSLHDYKSGIEKVKQRVLEMIKGQIIENLVSENYQAKVELND